MTTTPRLATALATALLLTAAALPARANPEAGYDLTMTMMDTNKDGMVSKKEFLDRMAKIWDMKAKKMNIKDDRMAPDIFEQQILMYLKAGG